MNENWQNEAAGSIRNGIQAVAERSVAADSSGKLLSIRDDAALYHGLKSATYFWQNEAELRGYFFKNADVRDASYAGWNICRSYNCLYGSQDWRS